MKVLYVAMLISMRTTYGENLQMSEGLQLLFRSLATGLSSLVLQRPRLHLPVHFLNEGFYALATLVITYYLQRVRPHRQHIGLYVGWGRIANIRKELVVL